jgi:hypothetical protein
MADWEIIGDTATSNSKGLKVVLKGGAIEEFHISKEIPRLAAQKPNLIDAKNHNLDVGFWKNDGKWVTIASFAPGIWLYVRPL